MREYHEHARTWLLAAGSAMADELSGYTVKAAHHAVGNRFDTDDRRDSELVVAAALAAGYLAEGADEEYAADVRAAARALSWPMPLNDRLKIARQLALVTTTDRSPYRELATCLRKTGPEYMAACGHLVRVVSGTDPVLLRTAWIELCGRAALHHLADAAPQLKFLAVAAWKQGQQKRDIASAAAISRPTLDRWISEATT
ncbi:hypothetical protein Lesp01_85110 [Lentzea sp. NBRC 102530]|nr:hypothetical protein Lesp01_85110 [Lentzea sp. NBRC 102530]